MVSAGCGICNVFPELGPESACLDVYQNVSLEGLGDKSHFLRSPAWFTSVAAAAKGCPNIYPNILPGRAPGLLSHTVVGGLSPTGCHSISADHPRIFIYKVTFHLPGIYHRMALSFFFFFSLLCGINPFAINSEIQRNPFVDLEFCCFEYCFK